MYSTHEYLITVLHKIGSIIFVIIVNVTSTYLMKSHFHLNALLHCFIIKNNTHTLTYPGGVLRKYLYGDDQSRLQNVDYLYTGVLQKNQKNKKQTQKKQQQQQQHPITMPHLWLNQPISIPFLLKWWPIIIIFISKTAHRHTITEIRGH